MLHFIQTLNANLHWLIIVLILCGLVDLIIISITRFHKLKINNTYINLHSRYGFLFVNILKIFLILVLSYLLFHPPGNAGALVFLIIVYSLVVFQLLFDFIHELIKSAN